MNSQGSNLPVYDVRTMADVMEASVAHGSVGLCGVLHHLVSQRTNEIGIRIVLGAKSRDMPRICFGTECRRPG